MKNCLLQNLCAYTDVYDVDNLRFCDRYHRSPFIMLYSLDGVVFLYLGTDYKVPCSLFFSL